MIHKYQIKDQDILSFWFSEENKPKWFSKDASFDEEIIMQFLSCYEAAISGQLDHWKASSLSTLAMIIILDQFPRNMFRDDVKSFATDHQALLLTKYALAEKMDEDLDDNHKQFLYMPLMHSEDLEDQKLCFELFAYSPQIQSYAKMHMDIIEKFGRFPHRNKILDRRSTDEELNFLNTLDSGF